jgi:hypothetical protein
VNVEGQGVGVSFLRLARGNGRREGPTQRRPARANLPLARFGPQSGTPGDRTARARVAGGRRSSIRLVRAG